LQGPALTLGQLGSLGEFLAALATLIYLALQIPMSIQDLGAIGELVGAVAVVVSLIYLATQIRQNTRQIEENTSAVRASAVHASLSYAFDNRAATYSDQGTSEIYHRGLDDPEALNDVERLRFRLIMANAVDAFWNMYSQTQMTGFSPETWVAQARIAKRVLGTNGGRWNWANYRNEYHEDFVREVDDLVAGDA
jgi:hypothetical protein